MTQERSKSLLSQALHHFFIDGFSAMAQGLFCTLIIGTILEQIAKYIPGTVGALLVTVANIAKILTGAGIGVAVASRFKRSPMVTVSAAVAGLIGAFAAQILTGNLLLAANPQKVFLIATESDFATLSGNLLSFSGSSLEEFTLHIKDVLEPFAITLKPLPGEPLGAFLAAFAAQEIGALVSGKTKLDILVTPLTTILSGSAVGLLVGPPVSAMMSSIGNAVNWGTEQQPILMGIVVAVLMGLALTLPISSAAIGVSLGLNGLAAGAAVVGCAAQMIGFAVASYRENKFSGLISQGIGTSMLQIPNIMRHPQIWVPATLTSAILGPLATAVFGMTCNATGAGMGTSGLVGPIMTFDTMTTGEDPTAPLLALLLILLLQFIFPAILSLIISEGMRKLGWIKRGWMKLD